MITFQKLRFKNIFSYGNVFTEIDLQDSPSTLIVGRNGSGKSSSLCDPLSFVLFGKAYRKINKNQLINSVNKKNLVVEVEFHTNGQSYLVRRGIKPNVFEIYQNDTLINQDAATKDYQEFLEKHILKMNFKSFCQIVILGTSTFIPFMQLTAQQRREIIEEILDLEIFTNMNIALKDKISTNKQDIQQVSNSLEIIKEKILVHRDMNKKLQENDESRKEDIKKKIDASLVKLEDYKALEIKKLEEIEELENSIRDYKEVSSKKSEIQNNINVIKLEVSSIDKELDFYSSHDTCPTCKQNIDYDHKDEIEDNKSALKNKLLDNLEIFKTEKEVLETRLSEISNIQQEISVVSRKISEIRGQIKSGNNFVKDLQDDLFKLSEEKKITIQEGEIDNLKKEWKTLDKKKEELLKDKEILDSAALMLKDTGIKSRIIKQYIPIINKNINKYLHILELPVGFELDECFTETIKSRFRDEFSYASFSEGEKARVNLALMFAWREIGKIRNSTSTNLMIMDEVLDSSTDEDGIENLMKIFNLFGDSTNIFVISHSEKWCDRLKSNIKVSKRGNFSYIEKM